MKFLTLPEWRPPLRNYQHNYWSVVGIALLGAIAPVMDELHGSIAKLSLKK